jgi:hypothetical protein
MQVDNSTLLLTIGIDTMRYTMSKYSSSRAEGPIDGANERNETTEGGHTIKIFLVLLVFIVGECFERRLSTP